MATKKQAQKNEPEAQAQPETEYEKDVMINIGGLWMNESKKGEIYFTGYLNGARLLILPNNFKKTDKEPDFQMNVLPFKKPDADSSSKQDKLKKMNQKKDNFDNDPPF